MTIEQAKKEAQKLFRIVHGRGDGGSPSEFNALNSDIRDGMSFAANLTRQWHVTENDGVAAYKEAIRESIKTYKTKK